MSPKKNKRGRPKKSATVINSEESQVFVLPPQLLQKLGINLSAIQHNQGPSSSSPPDNRRKSKRLISKKSDVLNISEISSKTRNTSKKSQNVTHSSESSMLETANLMKTSVFLSPTFIPPITPANIIDTEIEVSCSPRFPETIVNNHNNADQTLPKEMPANDTENHPVSNIEELENHYEAQNDNMINSNEEKPEFSAFLESEPHREGDIAREPKSKINTSGQPIAFNPAEPLNIDSAKYTNDPTGLLPVCDTSNQEMKQNLPEEICTNDTENHRVCNIEEFENYYESQNDMINYNKEKPEFSSFLESETHCEGDIAREPKSKINTSGQLIAFNPAEPLNIDSAKYTNDHTGLIPVCDTSNQEIIEAIKIMDIHTSISESVMSKDDLSDISTENQIKTVEPVENMSESYMKDINTALKMRAEDNLFVINSRNEDLVTIVKEVQNKTVIASADTIKKNIIEKSSLSKEKSIVLEKNIYEQKQPVVANLELHSDNILKSVKLSENCDIVNTSEECIVANAALEDHLDEAYLSDCSSSNLGVCGSSELRLDNKPKVHILSEEIIEPNRFTEIIRNAQFSPKRDNLVPVSVNTIITLHCDGKIQELEDQVTGNQSALDQGNKYESSEYLTNNNNVVTNNNPNQNISVVTNAFQVPVIQIQPLSQNNLNSSLVSEKESVENQSTLGFNTENCEEITFCGIKNDENNLETAIEQFKTTFINNDEIMFEYLDESDINCTGLYTSQQNFILPNFARTDKLNDVGKFMTNDGDYAASKNESISPTNLQVVSHDNMNVNNHLITNSQKCTVEMPSLISNFVVIDDTSDINNKNVNCIQSYKNVVSTSISAINYERYESFASEINNSNKKSAPETIVALNNVSYKQLSRYQEDEKLTETSDGKHLQAHDEVKSIEPHYKVQCCTINDRNDNKVAFVNNEVEDNKEENVKDTIEITSLKQNIKSKSLNQNHKEDTKRDGEPLNVILVHSILKAERSNTNYDNFNDIAFRPSIDSTSTSATYDDKEIYKYRKISDCIENNMIVGNNEVRVLDGNIIFSSDQNPASFEKQLDNKEQEKSPKANDKVAEIASYLEKCAHILTKRRKSMMSPKYSDGNRSPKYVRENVYKSSLNAEGVEKPGGLAKQEEDDIKVRNVRNPNDKTYKRSTKFPRPIKLYCDKPITDDEVKKITLSPNITLGLESTEEYCLCGDFGSIAKFGSNEDLYQHDHFENKSIGFCCVDLLNEQNYEEYIECQINRTEFNEIIEPNQEKFESICWNSVKDTPSNSHGIKFNNQSKDTFKKEYLNNKDNGDIDTRILMVKNSEISATTSKHFDVAVPKFGEKDNITNNSKLLANEEKLHARQIDENNDFDQESKKDAVSTYNFIHKKNNYCPSSSIGEEENKKRTNIPINTNLDNCDLKQNNTEIHANEVNLNADMTLQLRLHTFDKQNKKTGVVDQIPQGVTSTAELDVNSQKYICETRKRSAINYPQTNHLSKDGTKLAKVTSVTEKFQETQRRSRSQSCIQNNSVSDNALKKTKATIGLLTQNQRSENDIEQSNGNIIYKNPDGCTMPGNDEKTVSDFENESSEQIDDGSVVTIITIAPDENDKMYNEDCALTPTTQKQGSRHDAQRKSKKSSNAPNKEIKCLNSVATSIDKMKHKKDSIANNSQNESTQIESTKSKDSDTTSQEAKCYTSNRGMKRRRSSDANTSQNNVATVVEKSQAVEDSTDSKKIKCGVCQKGIGIKKWAKHISKEHCFIAWKDDEIIDLKNEELLCNLKAKVESGEKLICTFCKSDMKTSNKFLSHVRKCLQKYKCSLNKNIETNGETVNIPNQPSRPTISSLCAVCHEVVNNTSWFQHIEEKHNYLAWKDGETPVDLNQREDVRRHLGSLLDRYGYLNCPKCGGSWTELRAFRKHVKICSTESREHSPDVTSQENNTKPKRISESGIKAKELQKAEVSSEQVQNVKEAPKNTEIEPESQSKTEVYEGSRRKRGRPPKQKDSIKSTESDPEQTLKDKEHRKAEVSSEQIQSMEEAPKNMEIEPESQSKTEVNEGSRRKRGRPPKQKVDPNDSTKSTESDPEQTLKDKELRKAEVSSEQIQSMEEAPKNTEIEPESQSKTEVNEGVRRKRGRPPKQKADTTDATETTESDLELILKDKGPRKRGRPSKISQYADGDDTYIQDHQSSGDMKETPETFKKNIKTEKEETSEEAANPSLVECGVCQKQVESMYWGSHIMNEHRYLAWRSNETPLDLEDAESVQDHLITLSRKHKGLTCAKCGKIRRYPKSYLSHVETCQGLTSSADISNVSLNDTIQYVSETSDVLSTNTKVTCAICSNEINSADWDRHKLKKHYNLAWPVGANPIDLKAPYVVERYLKIYKSQMKAMVCNKCGASRASHMGFYAHVLTCNKTDEEIEEFKDRCEICNQKYLCIYKQQHYAIHKVQEETKERKRLAEEEAKEQKDNIIAVEKDGSGRRKAAEKARTVLENFSSAFQCKYSCPDCDYGTDDDKKMQFHKCKGNDPQVNDEEVEKISEMDAVESEGSAVDSDISAEVDVIEIARGKRRRHKKYSSVRPQLQVPYPVRDGKKFIRSSASEFLELNYTADTIFDGWKNAELVPVTEDCLPQYFPQIEESCKVKMEDDWSTYKRFEARKDGKGYSFFTGGSVQYIAWSPPRYKTEDCNQVSNYLAVSCHRGSDCPRLSYDELRSGANMLQIWDFQLFGDIEPKLVLGLAHDWGTIWSMDWCPSGTRDRLPQTNDGTPVRLGLLAVACSNGAAYILSVPNPSTLPVIDKLFYKLKPVVELRLNLEQKSCQATSIAWSKQKGHAMVVVGYSNGITAMYDLICESPLTRSEENGVTIIHPYHDERIYATAVTGVALFAGMNPTADTGLVGTSSPTGVTLSARGSAMAARVSIHNAVKDIRFLPHWPSLMLADDPITNTELDWLGPSRRLGTVRTCAGCDRCGVLLTCVPPLVRVVLTAHRTFKEAYKRNLLVLDMEPLAKMRSKKKSNDKFEMTVEPFTYEKAIEKYGIDVRFLTPKDTVAPDAVEPRPERYPLADVTTVAFCPTPQFHHRAAIATHAGVVFVISV